MATNGVASSGDTLAEYHPLNFLPINPYKVPGGAMPHMTDERIRGLMTWHVRAKANVKGRPNMKASDFQKWVNTELIPNHMPEHRGFHNRGISRAFRFLECTHLPSAKCPPPHP